MSDLPLISVIVPIYNVEKYLYEALDSLRKQTYSNAEFILVDDASKDDSRKIASEFVMKDNRFKLILCEHNGGLSKARNIGMQKARGDFLYFFDSDDILPVNLFEIVLDRFTNDIDIICFNRTDFKGEYSVEKVDIVSEKVASNVELLELLLNRKIETTVWSYVVRRELVVSKNLKFSEGRLFEDTDYTPILFSNVKKGKILRIKPYGYLYRVSRADSIMGKVNSKKTVRELEDKFYVLDRKHQVLAEVLKSMEVEKWFLNELMGLYFNFYVLKRKTKIYDKLKKRIRKQSLITNLNGKDKLKLAIIDNQFLFWLFIFLNCKIK